MFVKPVVAAAVALIALPAAAEQPVMRQVSFADLNLETDAGRATLERRLVRAVNSICAVNPAANSQAVRDEQDRCIAETSANMQSQIDAAVRANRARTANYASN